MDELSALLDTLPPEVLEQLLGLGTLDEEDALLAQQMEQAQALRKGGGRQYTTGLAAGLGGLADVISNVQGAYQQKQLTEERKGLLGKKDKARAAYADALRNAGRPAQLPPEMLRAPAQQAQAPMPGVPFSLRRPEELPPVWTPPSF